MVQLTTEYSLDHEVVSSLSQLYQVALVENNGEYKIRQLTNIGLTAIILGILNSKVIIQPTESKPNRNVMVMGGPGAF